MMLLPTMTMTKMIEKYIYILTTPRVYIDNKLGWITRARAHTKLQVACHSLLINLSFIFLL